jgi:hypothetical protein
LVEKALYRICRQAFEQAAVLKAGVRASRKRLHGLVARAPRITL